jgi:hypothetical protein
MSAGGGGGFDGSRSGTRATGGIGVEYAFGVGSGRGALDFGGEEQHGSKSLHASVEASIGLHELTDSLKLLLQLGHVCTQFAVRLLTDTPMAAATAMKSILTPAAATSLCYGRIET